MPVGHCGEPHCRIGCQGGRAFQLSARPAESFQSLLRSSTRRLAILLPMSGRFARRARPRPPKAPTSSSSRNYLSRAIRRKTWCSSRVQAGCRSAIETARARDVCRRSGLAGRHALAGCRQAIQRCRLLEGGVIAALRYKGSICRIMACSMKSACSRREPNPVRARDFSRRAPLFQFARIWGTGVVECLAETGAETVVPNVLLTGHRKATCAFTFAVARVTEQGLPTIYVNQVGDRIRWSSASACTRIARLHSSLQHFRKPLQPDVRAGPGGVKRPRERRS